MHTIIFNENDLGTQKKEFSFVAADRQFKFNQFSFLQIDDQKLESFLDRSQLRFMNRSTKILLNLFEKKGIRSKISKFLPHRVGLYCAVYGGNFPYKVFEKRALNPQQHFENCLAQLRPQDMLKRSNGVSAAQLGLYLGTTGPTLAYINKYFGAIQAIEQATFDLEQNKVDCAIVISALSLEDDPLTEIDIEGDDNNPVRTESAVIIGITGKSHDALLSKARQFVSKKREYGISQPLIDLSKYIKKL